VHKARTRFAIHFGADGRTPVAVSLNGPQRGPRVVVDVDGEGRRASSVFLLCRKPVGLVIGGSFDRDLLQTVRARLSSDPKAYEIVEVPVLRPK
jgi:hypothetical protein